jgi:ABC-2 type transport system permease protein
MRNQRPSGGLSGPGLSQRRAGLRGLLNQISTMLGRPTGPARIIAMVARRELVTRARTKSFLISNAIILVAILGGIVAASVFSGSSDGHTKLGLVGSAASLSVPLSTTAASAGSPLDTSTVTNVAAARAKVASGDLDAALLPRDGGRYAAVVTRELPAGLRSIIDSVVRQQATSVILNARGVDLAALARAAERATVTVDPVHPPDPDSDQRTAIAYIAMLLMFFQLLMFGLYVAMGVVEEKSSRVVEVLLATIKPLHLLWGKVLGIGAVGLLQLAAYGVVGLAAGIGTGLVTVTGLAVGVFASVLFWFILGFAFFAVCYAAAGSLVSRQEDVNSAATPITMLVMVGYIAAQVTVADPSGGVASVMSWIPPFSAMLMPLRIASGTTSPVQVVGSAVLMLFVTTALARVAARIYERSVLHTGTRVSWREAVRLRG